MAGVHRVAGPPTTTGSLVSSVESLDLVSSSLALTPHSPRGPVQESHTPPSNTQPRYLAEENLFESLAGNGQYLFNVIKRCRHQQHEGKAAHGGASSTPATTAATTTIIIQYIEKL